jgi:hypothetical protein
MKTTLPELPAWSFSMDEVSAGVYEVVGSDERGRRVSASGTDLDAVLEECRRQALRIESSANSQPPRR